MNVFNFIVEVSKKYVDLLCEYSDTFSKITKNDLRYKLFLKLNLAYKRQRIITTDSLLKMICMILFLKGHENYNDNDNINNNKLIFCNKWMIFLM